MLPEPEEPFFSENNGLPEHRRYLLARLAKASSGVSNPLHFSKNK
jgi:hypothetical protein